MKTEIEIAQIAVEVIQAVEDRLTDPEKWTKGHGARDQHGTPVATGSVYATCWCMEGALMLEHYKVALAPWRQANNYIRDAAIERTRGLLGLVEFNDLPQTTHADVLALLQEAKRNAVAVALEITA
jgi:hypothetical protein